MTKKIVLLLVIVLVAILSVSFGLPAFAQSYTATLIPGQPLSTIAAREIINNSRLPVEKLPDGTTNEVTRGRDAVNAYRYAHEQLYNKGWYRGISEDHTPLLVVTVEVLEREDYASPKATWEERKEEILKKFWDDSNKQNAKDLGFIDLEDFNAKVKKLKDEGKKQEANQMRKNYDDKWK